jgi:hypothetical protein
VRARSEGTAWVDDDADRIRRGLLPWRADPEWSDPDGPVKLAPALFPPRFDCARGDLGELATKAFLTGSVRIDGELVLALLEALRMEVEQPRPRLFQQFRRDRDRDPTELAQRKALLSLSKNPSSGR